MPTLGVKPDYVTLVPERREEVTTEGGLDIAEQLNRLSEVVEKRQNDHYQLPKK